MQQPGAGETEPQESGKSAIKQPDAKDAGDSQRGFELAVMPDGRQSKRVNELIHSGTSLRRPLLFLNRYLIGVVLTNLVVLSGLFELRKIGDEEGAGFVPTAIATLLAFIVGYATIAFLLRWLTSHSTAIFVAYRVALGALVIALTAAGAIS